MKNVKDINSEIRIKNKNHRRIIYSRRFNRMTIRFITALTALLMTATITCTFTSFARTGSSGRDSIPELKKYYTSVMIYPGDTPESIADKYCFPEGTPRSIADNFSSPVYSDKVSPAEEILSINHLSPDNSLQPGNHIIVPVYR